MTASDKENGLTGAPEEAAVHKNITDDYDCTEDCRNCPFPGAKCYRTKYLRYNTDLLIHPMQDGSANTENARK